jgi:hypothetical protein
MDELVKAIGPKATNFLPLQIKAVEQDLQDWKAISISTAYAN